MGNQTHMPRRRRFPKGTVTKRIQLFVTEQEDADLVALAVSQDSSLSEVMTTSTLSPKGGLSRAERASLVAELIQTRDALGSVVKAVRSTGVFTDADRAQLRALDDRWFNITEDMKQ